MPTIGYKSFIENKSITFRKDRITLQLDKKGGFIIVKYNKQGKVIYQNQTDGLWHRWKYDEKGKCIHAENRDIFIIKEGVHKHVKKENPLPYFLFR